MKIAELSVKHYQFTVLMFAMLAVLGVTSWLSIPRGEDPTFPAPNYTVVAVYPGANPTSTRSRSESRSWTTSRR